MLELEARIEKLRAKKEYLDSIAEMMLSKPIEELPKTLQNLVNNNELSITEFRNQDAAGKMFLIPVVGTICFACSRCTERMLNVLPGETSKNVCVCKYCYVQDSMNLEAEMFRLYRNHKMLQDLLPEAVIDNTARALVKLASTGKKVKVGDHAGNYDASFSVRGEAKGDTDSGIQALNYFRIAKRIKDINPAVNVSFWTKNPDHYESARALYANIYGKEITVDCFRENMTLIYSAFSMNQAGIDEIERVMKQYPIIKGGFMVYDEAGKNTETTPEADEYNARFVKEHYMSESCELFPCKCCFGSCGVYCNKCYDEKKRDTNKNFIAVERVR